MTPEEIMELNYFSPDKDTAIDWEKVDKDTLFLLDRARYVSGVPYIIKSNYRTPEHNAAIGGKPDSAHTMTPCKAFDIAFADHAVAWHIIHGLMEVGFIRIFINDKNHHIHADMETRLPYPRFGVE